MFHVDVYSVGTRITLMTGSFLQGQTYNINVLAAYLKLFDM